MRNHTQLDIGSSQLGYRKVGNGPDIVFVHGWPLHRETWRNVVAHLPDYTCHMIDLPGSGTSIAAASTTISLRNHVDAVVAAVDVLDLDKVVLVGHDSGGMIARFVAHKLPDRVSALILIGTEIPFHHSPLIDRLQLAARIPGATTVLKRLMNTPRVARSNQLFGGCFWNRDLIEGDFRTEVLDLTFRDSQAVHRQLDILASYTTDLVDELADVHPILTCPTLFVWGQDDPFFPVDKARAMVDQFGGPTRFEVIQHAKLLVHEEHPEQFAVLCADFLANADVTPSS